MMRFRLGIPPNGLNGTAQQTPATLAALASMLGGARRSSGTRRRKPRAAATRAAKRAAPRAAAAKRSRSKPARLVKGSAAAKRYMAKIRRKRR